MKKQQRPKAGTSKAEAERRRALFVEAYIRNGGNGKQAAIEAGFSEKTAESKATQLLREVKVAEDLERRRAHVIVKAEENTQLTVDGVLRELHSIVHADLRGAFDEKGALLPPSQWPDSVARAISSVKVVEMAGGMKVDEDEGAKHIPMYTKEVKLWDKNSGIDKAMKHLGLFEKDNAQRPPVGSVEIKVVGVRPAAR